MNILALEASGADIGIAALQIETGSAPQRTPLQETPLQQQHLAVFGSREPRLLSRGVITGLHSTLERAGWTLDNVEALAVGLGPGSWTSLRIALSTCKTLAQTRNLPLAGVATFDALAAAAREQVMAGHEMRHTGGALNGHTKNLPESYSNGFSANGLSAEGAVPQLPAQFSLLTTARSRPGELYGKMFRCGDDAKNLIATLREEWVDSPAVMAGQLSAAVDSADSLVLVGQGSEEVSAALTQKNVPHAVLAVTIEALAVQVARLGAAAIARGNADNALELQPLYVAPSAAERNLRK